MADSINASEISTIIMACEAGMGSSLMVVNTIKKKLRKAGIKDRKVIHKPARAVPADAKLVVVHERLAKVARNAAPDAVIITFKMFMNDPQFDKLVDAIVNDGDIQNMI